MTDIERLIALRGWRQMRQVFIRIGAIVAGSKSRVMLNEREGRLCHTLRSAHQQEEDSNQ